PRSRARRNRARPTAYTGVSGFGLTLGGLSCSRSQTGTLVSSRSTCRCLSVQVAHDSVASRILCQRGRRKVFGVSAGRWAGAGFALSSIGLLALLSLLFYGWWNPIYLLLIVPLMLVNFVLAARIVPRDGRRPPAARSLLVLGIVLNLATLGYFKYANFFVDNLHAVAGLDLALGTVVLPIGISFFTFQKIAFLVDAYRNRVDRLASIDYVLFVTFFPQLIAGPRLE